MQCCFKIHLTFQAISPVVPFQVCPVPTVRTCYRRCVIGMCIRVINVQEKGILQNERLFFIISLKKENHHSLVNVQNAQQPNWNNRKIASITREKEIEAEDKKIVCLRKTELSFHRTDIVEERVFGTLNTHRCRLDRKILTNLSSPYIIYSFKLLTDFSVSCSQASLVATRRHKAVIMCSSGSCPNGG